MTASFLNVLVSLEIKELQNILDRQFPEILLKNFSPEDSDILLNVQRSGQVKLSGERNVLEYQVPLDLLVEKNTFLGDVDVNFGIVLGFETQFLIKNNWELVTRTNLKRYQWTYKPKLKVGFLKIPLDTLVIKTLEKNKDTICQQIDARTMKELDIRPHLNQLIADLPNPITLAPSIQIFWQSQTAQTFLTGLATKNGEVRFAAGLEAPINISIGKPLEKIAIEVNAPEIKESLSDESNFQTKALIDYQFMQEMTMEFLQEQSLEIRGQEIRLEGIQFSKSSNKLKVTAQLTGSLKANLVIKGIPSFDESSGFLKFKETEVEITGDNLKTKTLLFFAREKIEIQIATMAHFPLKDMLEALKKKIAVQEFAPGILLNVELGKVNIQEIQVLDDAIEGQLEAKGLLHFQLKSPTEVA